MPMDAIQMNIDALKLLDRIDQYVYLKSVDGTYIYANEKFVHISGMATLEEIIGKTDYDLAWRDQAKDNEAADREVFAGKTIIKADKTQIRATGFARIIESKCPFRCDRGEIIGLLGNFFDCDNRLILETTGSFDEKKHRLYLEFIPEWLSLKEVRVCFYLIHGFSAQRIAEKTGTSVSTVRFHIENIKEKMQCANKNEIVEIAMKTGVAWKILTLHHANDPLNEQ